MNLNNHTWSLETKASAKSAIVNWHINSLEFTQMEVSIMLPVPRTAKSARLQDRDLTMKILLFDQINNRMRCYVCYNIINYIYVLQKI